MLPSWKSYNPLWSSRSMIRTSRSLRIITNWSTLLSSTIRMLVTATSMFTSRVASIITMSFLATMSAWGAAELLTTSAYHAPSISFTIRSALLVVPQDTIQTSTHTHAIRTHWSRTIWPRMLSFIRRDDLPVLCRTAYAWCYKSTKQRKWKKKEEDNFFHIFLKITSVFLLRYTKPSQYAQEFWWALQFHPKKKKKSKLHFVIISWRSRLINLNWKYSKMLL